MLPCQSAAARQEGVSRAAPKKQFRKRRGSRASVRTAADRTSVILELLQVPSMTAPAVGFAGSWAVVVRPDSEGTSNHATFMTSPEWLSTRAALRGSDRSRPYTHY